MYLHPAWLDLNTTIGQKEKKICATPTPVNATDDSIAECDEKNQRLWQGTYRLLPTIYKNVLLIEL